MNFSKLTPFLLLVLLPLTGCASFMRGGVTRPDRDQDEIVKEIERKGCDYAALWIENQYRLDASVKLLRDRYDRQGRRIASNVAAYQGDDLACITPGSFYSSSREPYLKIDFIGTSQYVTDRLPRVHEGTILRVVIPSNLRFGYPTGNLHYLPIYIVDEDDENAEGDSENSLLISPTQPAPFSIH